MVLFLNDVGTGEVMLILVFILIFFGSKSIPGLARTMGRTIRQIKDASSDLQAEIKKSTGDIKGDLNLKEIIDDTTRDIRKPLDQYATDIEDALKRKPIHSQPKKPYVPPKVPEIAPENISEPSLPIEPAVEPKIDKENPPTAEN